MYSFLKDFFAKEGSEFKVMKKIWFLTRKVSILAVTSSRIRQQIRTTFGQPCRMYVERPAESGRT
jgi:hypothetical protein